MKTLNAILVSLGIALSTAKAHAELVVIVSVKNPTSTVSQKDVEKIFLGKLKLFPDGNSAIPLDLPDKLPHKDEFYAKAVGKSHAQMRAYWSKMIFTGSGAPPQVVDSPEDMLKLVAENPNTIGYVEKELINEGVKVIMQVQ